MEPETLDKKAKKELGTAVEAAVKECLAGEYATKNELLDKLIADITALKDEVEEPGMGGMGEEEGMTLPEPEEEEA